jgi:hypothetical protein
MVPEARPPALTARPCRPLGVGVTCHRPGRLSGFGNARRAPIESRLFVYGSLQLPQVMRLVAGRHFPSALVRLEGYARFRVRGEVYPGIVSCPGEQTAGLLPKVLRRRPAAQLRVRTGHAGGLCRGGNGSSG